MRDTIFDNHPEVISIRNEMRALMGLEGKVIMTPTYSIVINLINVYETVVELSRDLVYELTFPTEEQLVAYENMLSTFDPTTFVSFMIDRFFSNETYTCISESNDADVITATNILITQGHSTETAEIVIHKTFMLLANYFSKVPLGVDSNYFRTVSSKVLDKFGNVMITYHYYDTDVYDQDLNRVHREYTTGENCIF